MVHIYTSLLIVVLCLVCNHAHVEGRMDEIPEEWGWEEYPHPMVDTEECGRRDRPSLICDPNSILTFEQASVIDQLLTSIRTDTVCPCRQFYSQNKKGYHMSIALVNKMKPYRRRKEKGEKQSVDDTLHMAEMFTVFLENSKWKSGQCGEDVVLFYSMVDNVIYAVTGKKAREKLTDKIASEILMENRRHLAPGKNIYKGLHNIVQGFKNVFLGTYGQTSTPQPPKPTFGAVIGENTAHTHMPYTVLYAVTVVSLLYILDS